MAKEASQEEPARKFGEGALAASWRLGHKEIGQALRALPDSLPLHEEPGAMNNPTSHGISQQAGYVQPVSSVNHDRQQSSSIVQNQVNELRMGSKQQPSMTQEVQHATPNDSIVAK